MQCSTCQGTGKYYDENQKELVCHCVTDYDYADELLKDAPFQHGGARPGAGRKSSKWGERRLLSIVCSGAEFELIKSLGTRMRAMILLAEAKAIQAELDSMKHEWED